MIHLAYDGSINGDWVAWYAINLAQRDPDLQLHVIHINTNEIKAEEVRIKAAALKADCLDAGVDMILDIVPSSKGDTHSIFKAICDQVPENAQSLLVCGVRLRPSGQGYLSGTVAAKLLSDRSFNVIAVRVAQPGLLGAPRRILVPVAGGRKGFLMGADILKRFGSNVARIHLLRVMMIKHQLFRRLLNDQAKQLSAKGWASLSGLDTDLSILGNIEVWKIDANVVVSDDWAHEVIIAANRYKSQLILMEASRKDLRNDFVYGNPIEVVLRDTPCDVAIYRGV